MFLRHRRLSIFTTLLATFFNVSGIPMLIIVGPDGKILEAHRGYHPRSAKELKQLGLSFSLSNVDKTIQLVKQVISENHQ